MKIAFTICSNNYLAQAKTLADSVISHNSDYKFIICLCDKKNKNVDYSFFHPHQVLEASELKIKRFDEMSYKYDIIEFNTSIKPFVFDYIYNNFPDAELVMYFDPDTCVFNNLTLIEQEIENSSILLTPHIYTPIEFDGKNPTENTFTQHGIYNLGFLATKRSNHTFELIDWWKRRLEINCYNKTSDGIFVDQLPMNFATIFFKEVKISDNWGLNMAPWNLHERDLYFCEDKYFVNDKYPLIFYHFSNYNPFRPEILASYYDRVTFEGHDVLRRIYNEYRDKLISNKYEQFNSLSYSYKLNKLKSLRKKSTISKICSYLKKYPLFLIRRDFWF